MFHRKRSQEARSENCAMAILIEIVVDRNRLEASVNFVGEDGEIFDAEEGSATSDCTRRRALISRPTLCCPTIPGFGPRWCTQAEAYGAVASTMPTPSPKALSHQTQPAVTPNAR